MGSLDMIFKNLKVTKVWILENYWTAYVNILKVNQIEYSFFKNFNEIINNLSQFKDSAIIICDPNNPTGNKIYDEYLLQIIEILNKTGIVIIWDSPYRKLFFEWEEDNFYTKLLKFNNLIISESFSKSVGLSGQRLVCT